METAQIGTANLAADLQNQEYAAAATKAGKMTVAGDNGNQAEFAGKAEKKNVNQVAANPRADADEMTPERREFLLSQTHLGQSVVKARRDAMEDKFIADAVDGKTNKRLRKSSLAGKDSGKAPKVLGKGKNKKCTYPAVAGGTGKETTRNLVS